MVDDGKAAAVEGVETSDIAQARIEAGRRSAEDARMRQLIHEKLPKFFAAQETPMPPTAVGEEKRSATRPGLILMSLDRVLEYRLLGNPRLQPEADEHYHAACYGAFIAGMAIELRKLLAAACVTNGVPPDFG
eukprot:jgi/Tetstr1/460607/TSEL_000532.t1